MLAAQQFPGAANAETCGESGSNAVLGTTVRRDSSEPGRSAIFGFVVNANANSGVAVVAVAAIGFAVALIVVIGVVVAAVGIVSR